MPPVPRAHAQVRTAATATLQTAVVSAEVLGVLPGSLERGLREWMLPPLEALSKKIGGKGKRDLPQVGSDGVGHVGACAVVGVALALDRMSPSQLSGRQWDWRSLTHLCRPKLDTYSRQHVLSPAATPAG